MMAWEEFRFRLGLGCLLMAVLFVWFNSFAHRWAQSSIVWIGLLVVGVWYLLIQLPQGDRQRRLQHVRTLGDLLACTPREFERHVGDILAETG